MKTFEEFLQLKHSEYYMGIDDDMPDKFETWLSNLDIEELLQLGDSYGVYVLLAIKGVTNK